ncbi:MAG: SDR family NAD(P)-dependent oxidoreductase [Cognaticolwellia sp.]
MSVSIIGCGWLGQALAQKLLANNIEVVASFQSLQTKEKLKQLAIPAVELKLPIAADITCDIHLDNIAGIDGLLFRQKVLIIAIPPQLKKGRVDYPLKIQQLVQLAQLGSTEHIILLNSTAIYNGLTGQVDENSRLDFSAEKVSCLFEAEQALQGFAKTSHILRLAGLVGPNRHPGKFLQSKRLFANASAAVNLVHQSDVVNILIALSQSTDTTSRQRVYNVVSNTNCDRQHYYQVAAQALNLPAPQFADEPSTNAGKRINGYRLRRELAYNFQYDDLLSWVADTSTA